MQSSRLNYFSWPLVTLVTLAASCIALAQDREREKAMEQRLRRLAIEQLDRTLADTPGSSPISVVKRVTAAWDSEKEKCDASARSREEKYACADMVVYGTPVASLWLGDHQMDGETIYGAQMCLHNPPAGMIPCTPLIVLPSAYQSDPGCKSYAVENWERNYSSTGARNDYYCKARIAKDKNWNTVFSKTSP